MIPGLNTKGETECAGDEFDLDIEKGWNECAGNNFNLDGIWPEQKKKKYQ